MIKRPGLGDFGWQALASALETTAQDLVSPGSLFGMVPEALYLWGTVRDEEGNLYSPMRRIPFDTPGKRPDTRRRFFLQTTLDSPHYRMHPAGRHSAVNDGHSMRIDGDNVSWSSAPAAPGKPFLAEWSPTACRWMEGDAMDIRGRLVNPGMQWYLPGRSASMLYVGHIFEMEGHCLGRPVRGFIGFDVIHMYDGGEVYRTKDALVQEQLEVSWYTWATRYKDGSIDAGHFMLGNDKFGFAILTDENGDVRFTYDVDGEVSLEPDGYWHSGVRLSALGQEWEFLPDPVGRMPELGPIPNPQVEGRWRRIGDTREPEVWFAWGEAAPGHGQRPTDRLPGAGRRIATAGRRFPAS